MVFQKGDKVSFLNEALNGVVVDYINDSHVLVDCQGIEMDVSAQELIRITFIPPPVEPAQPPIKLDSTNKTGKNNGQSAKEVVVKPAVVEMETD